MQSRVFPSWRAPILSRLDLPVALACCCVVQIAPRFLRVPPLELAVDNGGQAVPDGEDGRGRIECRWRLHAASFCFGYTAERDEFLLAADASRCFSWSCSKDISRLRIDTYCGYCVIAWHAVSSTLVDMVTRARKLPGRQEVLPCCGEDVVDIEHWRLGGQHTHR